MTVGVGVMAAEVGSFVVELALELGNHPGYCEIQLTHFGSRFHGKQM